MFDSLGLGVRLTLDNDLTNRVDPLIRDIERLERAARQTTQSFNNFNGSMSSYLRAQQIQELNRALQGTGAVLNNVSQRLISASYSANAFATSMNRMQAVGNLSRMTSEITSVQRQLANLGFGMSALQQKMSDTRAYNAMNYQLKELHDRINLTRQALTEMQNAPDSSRYTEEIRVARQALTEYERQLSRVNQQQVIARNHGLSMTNINGRDTMLRMPDTMRENLTNRLIGASMRDVGIASNIAYQSIDKTAKALVGYGYTAMEARQRTTQLAGTLTMVGTALSQFVTLPLGIATAALTTFYTRWEEASNKFQARTLLPKELQGSSMLELRRISVDTGQTMDITSDAMSTSYLINQSKGMGEVYEQTKRALHMQSVWGIDSQKSLADVNKIMTKFGVNSKTAWDMYVAGAMESKKELGKNFTGTKGMERIMEMVEESPNKFKNLTKATGEYADAYDRMVNNWEKGLGEELFEFLGNSLTVLGQLFQAVVPPMTKFFGVLNDGAQAFSAFLESHPMLSKIAGTMLAVGGAFLMSIGPILLLTGGLLRFKSVIEGVSASVFGLSKGGLAILSPQAQMAKSNMDAFTKSMARAPQTILSTIPLLYSALRMIPNLIFNMAKANPIFAGLTVGLVAYTNNWWGLRDTVNGAVDTMKKKWNEVVDLYQNSSLPKTLKTLKENAIEFGKGFWEGLGVAVDMGKMFVNFVLAPIKELASRLDPVLTNIANSISKMFGGEGDMKEGAEKWKNIGKVLGTVVGGLLAIKGIVSIGSYLVSPFVKMNDAVRNVGGSLDRVISRVGILSRTGAGAVGGAVAGMGSRVAGGARYIFGSNGNNPVVGSPNILQRGMSLLGTPFRAMQSRAMGGLAGMGVGSGRAMAQQRAQARASGRALSATPALMGLLRRGQGSMANLYNPLGMTANGRVGGNQVFRSNQGAISRALLGQRMYTYSTMRNAQGQITGTQRNYVGRSGGLFRGSAVQAGGATPNLLQRGWGGMTSAIGNGMNALTGGMASAMLSRPRSMFDAMRGSAVAGGLASAGRWGANRLALANVANPFAGALRTTNATGDALTRRQMTRNFVRTTAGGMGSMAMGGARIAGRGASAVGRGAMGTARMGARAVGGAGRALGAVGGGLLAAAPWLVAGGIAGKLAYDKLGVGADGKKSVSNVSGNLDKITAGIGKDGGKNIDAFWKKFKTEGSKILKSVVALIGASLKALGPKIPGMLKDAFNGIKSLAKATWNWVKTDGLKMAKATGKGLMSVLSSAWQWIKTDGVKYLGQFWTWLTGTAVPKAGSLIQSGLGKAWGWVKTDGVRLLGELITWLIGTAIPKTISFLMEQFGKAFKWIFTDGLKMFGNLLVEVGSIAVSLGKALWDGITSALSGLGEWFMGLLPSMSDVKAFFTGGDKTKKHARGGFVTAPHLGIVGEAGPEVIIPLSGNMRNIAGGLLQDTASMLGFDVAPKGQGVETASPSANQAHSSAPVRQKAGGGGTPSSIDNSVQISKLEIVMPKEMAGVGEQSARQQATLIMKELQKMMKQERLRSNSKNLSLEDLVLNA